MAGAARSTRNVGNVVNIGSAENAVKDVEIVGRDDSIGTR